MSNSHIGVHIATHGAFLPSVPSHFNENNIGNINNEKNINATRRAIENRSDRFFYDTMIEKIDIRNEIQGKSTKSNIPCTMSKDTVPENS